MYKVWTKVLVIIIMALGVGTVMSGTPSKIISIRIPAFSTGKVFDPLEEERKQQEIEEIHQMTAGIEEQRRERIFARQADRRRKNLLKGAPEEAISVLESRLTELEERVAALEARLMVKDANGLEDL